MENVDNPYKDAASWCALLFIVLLAAGWPVTNLPPAIADVVFPLWATVLLVTLGIAGLLGKCSGDWESDYEKKRAQREWEERMRDIFGGPSNSVNGNVSGTVVMGRDIQIGTSQPTENDAPTPDSVESDEDSGSADGR